VVQWEGAQHLCLALPKGLGVLMQDGAALGSAATKPPTATIHQPTGSLASTL